MKNNYIFSLLFIPCFAFGQARHDIKLDLMKGFLRTAFLSYEASPSKHFGIELGFGYEWGKLGLFTAGVPSAEDYQSYAQNIGQVSVTGKYYPSKRANSDRWFIGGYINEKYELSRDPNYSSAYQKAYGHEPTFSQNIWTGLGGTVGYKKVFGNRLLLELGFSTEFNLAALLASKEERTFDFGGTIQAKVGYRIAAPKEDRGLSK